MKATEASRSASSEARLVGALEGLIVGAVGMTTAALDAFAPDYDLTLQQWRALVVVARSDGIRVGEIGDRVGLAPPSASRLIRRLERRGLVETARDETDRRAIVVRASRRGHELWSTLVAHRRGLIVELLRDFRMPAPQRLVSDIEALEQAFSRYS
ncbi:MAG TPA: MarR family transcriptional regulator [Candidatus Limnocylindrales bacterium]|nr:MarR family transcriptional regulator [Candidatus Limnocylindrales bacterium]